MKRMKTFLIYFLIFIGFFIFSVCMEALYIYNSYVSIKDNGNIENNSSLAIEVPKAKATKMNGVMTLRVKNKTSENISHKYIKVDLVDKQNLYAATKYIPIDSIDAGQTIEYKVEFRANDIKKYNVSITDEEQPIEPDIINVFGYDVDIDNMIVTIKDVSGKMPDFVYAAAGIWTAIKTGKIMWAVIFMV